ncbi:MAG: DUF2520 domain-containing protein [Flavobacteriaceae bacterium]|jgi:predicted short-subunit dehydrogenase-like oxidoreductase (DUF2520 family)|nr:DUF2520 domain-containing protein [Flavobacteriaceae bacterium]
MAKKVVILGAGNVAFHLTKALLENTVNVVQIFNRTLEKAENLANNYNIRFTNQISEIEQADLYIICASDRAISEISYYIPFEDCLVVHTSGSMPVSVLKGKYRKGVFYPLQTFSKKRMIEYGDIPFLVEAENADDEQLLVKLSERISKEVHVVDSEKRLKIHMAAIWAGNFTNHMYFIGNEVCKQQNLPFDILRPLIKETCAKVMDGMLPYDAQTGPAKRKDTLVIDKHLALLENSKYLQVYKTITDSIIKTYND